MNGVQDAGGLLEYERSRARGSCKKPEIAEQSSEISHADDSIIPNIEKYTSDGSGATAGENNEHYIMRKMAVRAFR